MSEALEMLKARPVGPVVQPKVRDTDLSSKIEVTDGKVELTVNDREGTVDESTGKTYLLEEGLNPEDWKITGFRKIKYGNPAMPMESVRFTYAPVRGVETFEMPDLDDLHRAIKASTPIRPRAQQHGSLTTLVADIADPQTGKTGERGGTEELLVRLEKSLARWTEKAEEVRPAEILVLDGGDAIENFESVASEERTNDLQLTEQIRVWRRIFWSWIDRAADLAPVVKVASVPSNHCRVRRGKGNLGTPADDYGIEVLSQVADMASVYPERYGHVSFHSPAGESESLAIPLVGGKIIGAAHGHQVTNPNNFAKWLGGQALGRTPISAADIFLFHHFHHLRIEAIGDDRWFFIAPTSDNGSSWFRNLSGNESEPGVLSFLVDERGWYGLDIC